MANSKDSAADKTAASKKTTDKSTEASKPKDYIQRSLVVLKPDAVQRGIVGEIIQRFERVGLKIVGMKMVNPDEKLYRMHYEDIGQMITRRGEQCRIHDDRSCHRYGLRGN